MPSLLLSDVPGTAGLWRVAPMPTADGSSTNSENGGSALGVLQSSRKPNAAFRFVEYACHEEAGIRARVDGGAFPADTASLNALGFLSKTTIKDSRGISVPYFGGQEFNKVLSKAAERVSVGYQYLPFEVYARSDFRGTVGQAYRWSTAERSAALTQARIDAGMLNSDGSKIAPPKSPGPKISLDAGIALWQKDLKEYGVNQGFTIQ
jgi:multiple sugar transport system substrate-binding protein